MTNPIPKWVMARYSKLWKKFEGKKITFDDIKSTLTIDDNRLISVFLNELKTASWVDIELDQEDSRKRIYTLKNPQEIVEEIAKRK